MWTRFKPRNLYSSDLKLLEYYVERVINQFEASGVLRVESYWTSDQPIETFQHDLSTNGPVAKIKEEYIE